GRRISERRCDLRVRRLQRRFEQKGTLGGEVAVSRGSRDQGGVCGLGHGGTAALRQQRGSRDYDRESSTALLQDATRVLTLDYHLIMLSKSYVNTSAGCRQRLWRNG